jgi:hypothetical protein
MNLHRIIRNFYEEDAIPAQIPCQQTVTGSMGTEEGSTACFPPKFLHNPNKMPTFVASNRTTTNDIGGGNFMNTPAEIA